jgi:hypothetical protein
LVLFAAAVHGDELRLSVRAPPWPHSITIMEFGIIGDEETLNTVPFENAVFYVRSAARVLTRSGLECGCFRRTHTKT